MDRDRLLLGLAAVFAGLTTLLSVAALAEQPFLLLLAIPFAATTYFLWYHASGRLEARVRARAHQQDAPFAAERGERTGFGTGGAQGGARGARGRASAGAARRAGTGGRAGARGRTRTARGNAVSAGPSRAEAYRTLDLEPGAGTEEIRRAYREKVKTAHPDTETGDAESFQRINRAYERLNG